VGGGAHNDQTRANSAEGRRPHVHSAEAGTTPDEARGQPSIVGRLVTAR
jgi:hypothetical protein